MPLITLEIARGGHLKPNRLVHTRGKLLGFGLLFVNISTMLAIRMHNEITLRNNYRNLRLKLRKSGRLGPKYPATETSSHRSNRLSENFLSSNIDFWVIGL